MKMPNQVTAHSCQRAEWRTPFILARTGVCRRHMRQSKSGVLCKAAGVRVFPGNCTATGRRVGILIPRKSAPMYFICWMTKRANKITGANAGGLHQVASSDRKKICVAEILTFPLASSEREPRLGLKIGSSGPKGHPAKHDHFTRRRDGVLVSYRASPARCQ
jgi:hypothetical protein